MCASYLLTKLLRNMRFFACDVSQLTLRRLQYMCQKCFSFNANLVDHFYSINDGKISSKDKEVTTQLPTQRDSRSGMKRQFDSLSHSFKIAFNLKWENNMFLKVINLLYLNIWFLPQPVLNLFLSILLVVGEVLLIMKSERYTTLQTVL